MVELPSIGYHVSQMWKGVIRNGLNTGWRFFWHPYVHVRRERGKKKIGNRKAVDARWRTFLSTFPLHLNLHPFPPSPFPPFIRRGCSMSSLFPLSWFSLFSLLQCWVPVILRVYTCRDPTHLNHYPYPHPHPNSTLTLT